MQRLRAVEAWALLDTAALELCGYNHETKLEIISEFAGNTKSSPVTVTGQLAFRLLLQRQLDASINAQLLSLNIVDGSRTTFRVATHVFRPSAGCYVRTVESICDTFDPVSKTLTRCIKPDETTEHNVIPWQQKLQRNNKTASSTFLSFYLAVWARDTKQLKPLLDADAVLTMAAHDCTFTLRGAAAIVDYMELLCRMTRFVDLVSFDSNFQDYRFTTRVIVREERLNMRTMTWSEYTNDTIQDICISTDTNTINQIHIH